MRTHTLTIAAARLLAMMRNGEFNGCGGEHTNADSGDDRNTTRTAVSTCVSGGRHNAGITAGRHCDVNGAVIGVLQTTATISVIV